METKEITGTIQAIRKDFKALEINNEWFNFFKANSEFKKGNIVVISYSVNQGFNNIKKITLTESKPEIKELKSIPNQTQNTILMNVKDIIIADLNNKTTFSREEIKTKILSLTDCFKEAYNKL
jgi:hypothetical protein